MTVGALSVHIDRRMGGRERCILLPEGQRLMYIPEEISKCVCYVGYRMANGTEKLAGSAFLISKSYPEHNLGFSYISTARHVLDYIRDKRGIDKCFLRFNLKDGRLGYYDCPIKDWTTHPDKTADVAMLPFGIQPPLDHLSFDLNSVATEQVIQEKAIGVGDEVCVIGLFSAHYGRKANLPIARVGNIAAMPTEKVSTKIGDMDAYLVEVRSIGGLSGSPVFVNVGGQRKYGLVAGVQYYFLGLIHGHFDVPASVVDVEEIAEDGLETVKLNMGMAIVTPAQKVLEVLDMFEGQRQKELQKVKDATLPAMDVSSVEDNPPGISREEFEEALKKVSRKIAPEK